MLKVDYYASRAIPSRRANGVHVAKMSSAFLTAGVKYRLFCFEVDKIDIASSITSYYGLKNNIDTLVNYIKPSNVDILLKMLNSKISGTDIIFTRSPKFAFVALKLRFKVVLEIHAPLSDEVNPHRWMQSMAKDKNLIGVVVITDKLKERVIGDYPLLDKAKVHTFADGADKVDLEHKQLQSIMSVVKVSGYSTNVGYTGTAGTGRGLELFLYLAKSLPAVGFHLVGMTSDDFYRFVTEDNIKPSNLIFHGFQDSSLIPYYIQSFDLLLAPYQKVVIVPNKIGQLTGTDTGQWMSPIKVFEYMASGVPFFASDLPVLREVLSDSNCTLIDAEKFDVWHLQITDFINNPTEYKLKSISAKSELECKYTWEARAKKISETFFVENLK